MSDQQLTIQPPQDDIPELKSLTTLAKEYIPKLQRAHDAAVAEMKGITAINSDDDLEGVESLIVDTREAYKKMVTLRKEMTAPLDAIKDRLMEYERPLSDDKGSEYTRVRGLVGAYNQKKIDDKKRIEADAAKKKLRENHLVDVGTAILQKLNDLLLTKTKEAESKSKAYFDATKLEEFDARAEQYRKMKPSLKVEDYAACFTVPYNNSLLSVDDYTTLVAELKKEESYEKWNEEVVKTSTPIVNAWRAKIPELKENLIKLKNAASDAERDRLAAEQKRKAEEEETRRRAELEQQNLAKSMELQSQANLSKLENSFVEQATVQQSGDTGPVKLVLKFTDEMKILKPLTEIIYHCLASPKFEGIHKKDKSGYIPAVQFWIDFFLKNCDADIAGTTVTEEAKVIIRK